MVVPVGECGGGVGGWSTASFRHRKWRPSEEKEGKFDAPAAVVGSSLHTSQQPMDLAGITAGANPVYSLMPLVYWVTRIKTVK